MPLDTIIQTFAFIFLSIARGFVALLPFSLIYWICTWVRMQDLMPFPPFQKMFRYSLIPATISFFCTSMYTYGQMSVETTVNLITFSQFIYPALLFSVLQGDYKRSRVNR